MWVETRRRSQGAGGGRGGVDEAWAETRSRKHRQSDGGTSPSFIGHAARGEWPCRSKRHHPNRALRLAPIPHVARQLRLETASLRFRQGHPKQWEYCALTPRDVMKCPHRNWHANHPAKTHRRPVEGPACPLGRLTSFNQRVHFARANVARTVYSLARSQPRWPQR